MKILLTILIITIKHSFMKEYLKNKIPLTLCKNLSHIKEIDFLINSTRYILRLQSSIIKCEI